MACRCLPYRSQCLVPRIRNRKCFAFCALAEVWRQILCFIRHLPLQPWGSRKVNLVSLKRTVDGSMQYCPVSWTFGSSDRLGYKAALPKNVLAFMNNPNGRCFIFPDNHMGPVLLFFLQDVEINELILGGLRSKLVSPHLDLSGWREALNSVTPDFFYTTNVSII